MASGVKGGGLTRADHGEPPLAPEGGLGDEPGSAGATGSRWGRGGSAAVDGPRADELAPATTELVDTATGRPTSTTTTSATIGMWELFLRIICPPPSAQDGRPPDDSIHYPGGRCNRTTQPGMGGLETRAFCTRHCCEINDC